MYYGVTMSLVFEQVARNTAPSAIMTQHAMTV